MYRIADEVVPVESSAMLLTISVGVLLAPTASTKRMVLAPAAAARGVKLGDGVKPVVGYCAPRRIKGCARKPAKW